MNTMISMYSRFGNIEGARYLFDKMSERNEASWNSMVSAYVQVGCYHDAVKLFGEMCHWGVETSGYVVASLMAGCSRSMDMVHEGFQIHGLILKLGLLSNVFVGSSLLHFYGAHGFPSRARTVFNELPEKNVVSWTALMVMYLDEEDPSEVLNVYEQFRHEGLKCNQTTFTAIISSCGLLKDESIGLQVLAQVIKSGYENNISVANSLISMFGNFGSTGDACYIFEHMNEHDTISWNSMVSAYSRNALCVESLKCFHAMRFLHNKVTAMALSPLISVCGNPDNLKWGRGIHGMAVKMGLDLNVCVSNTLITMYSEGGRPKDAETLFRRMPEWDLISWNSLVAGYVSDGRFLDALKMFEELLKMGKTMNYITLTSALAACSSPEFLLQGKAVHALVITGGLHENVIVGNAVVTMYAKCSVMREAKVVFEKMSNKDLITWNALIGGYAETEDPSEAIRFFKSMRAAGTPANYITIVNILGACSASDALTIHGMPIHAHIIQTGFSSDEYVNHSLITMYAKCGDPGSSNCIFNRLLHKNHVTWNAVVAANAHHGDREEALKLFADMRRAGVDPDQFSLSAALSASSNLAVLDKGQQLHCLATKLGFYSYIYVINATMDMYGKCGEMLDVFKMLPEANTRSRLSWNILISSLARHGHFEEARETFQDMINHGSKPDHVTFVSLLSACSHGGLVDEGLAYFDSMTKEYGVPVAIEHCVCIVDLLGRSGRLYEADDFIKQMPVPPNDFIWRSLLAACRIHGNLELGEKATENLLQCSPSDDSPYVLYSNLCATSGKWDHAVDIRRRMHSCQIKRKQGRSWII